MLGLDLLGLGSKFWDLRATIKGAPLDFAIGAFDGTEGDATFGNALPKIKKLCDKGYSTFRIQLWYKKSKVIIPDKILKPLAIKWDKLAAQYPNAQFRLSHSCEHNEKQKKIVEHKMALLREYAPHCLPINNPLNGARLVGETNECHGVDQKFSPPYEWSLDGGKKIGKSVVDAADLDMEEIQKKYADALILFNWGLLFNLQDGDEPADPAKRRAAPGIKYLKAFVRLIQPYGTPPVSFNAIPIKKPLLYKPISRGTGDNREWKPVFVSRSKGKVLRVVTCTDKEIGTLGYYDTFTGGLYRHYSGCRGGSNLWGYEFGQKALQQSGSDFVWLTDGQTHWGPCNPAFREGYYR